MDPLIGICAFRLTERLNPPHTSGPSPAVPCLIDLGVYPRGFGKGGVAALRECCTAGFRKVAPGFVSA
jgi:hypothetical protein